MPVPQCLAPWPARAPAKERRRPCRRLGCRPRRPLSAPAGRPLQGRPCPSRSRVGPAPGRATYSEVGRTGRGTTYYHPSIAVSSDHVRGLGCAAWGRREGPPATPSHPSPRPGDLIAEPEDSGGRFLPSRCTRAAGRHAGVRVEPYQGPRRRRPTYGPGGRPGRFVCQCDSDVPPILRFKLTAACQ